MYLTIGRIIIITTHFMDEADILADRILIMTEGKLQVTGSPLFLKNVFGVGYTLYIVKLTQNVDENETVIKLVKSFIPQAEIISNVGAELSFRLPFASSVSFNELFLQFDDFKNRNDLIKEYGISVTTLEEVFMRVGKLEHLNEKNDPTVISDGPEHFYDVNIENESKLCNKHENIIGLYSESAAITSTLHSPIIPTTNLLQNEKSEFTKSVGLTKPLKPWTFFSHFASLFRKRVLYGIRDRRMLLCQLILPLILVILGLSLLLIVANYSQPSLVLSPDKYNPLLATSYRNFVPTLISQDSVYSYDLNGLLESGTASNDSLHSKSIEQPRLDSSFASQVISRFNGDNVYGISVPLDNIPLDEKDSFEGCSQGASPLNSMSRHLLETPASNDEKGSSRYGAITLSSLTNTTTLIYNLMINESAIHGVGIYANLLHTAYLQVKSGISSASITARNYPLPKTLSEDQTKASISAFIGALFISIAYCFIPSSYASFIVKEREIQAMFQQIISGMNPYSYWCATLTWDFLSYLPTAGLTILVLYAYDVTSFIRDQGLTAIFLLLLLYGPAIASFTYLTSFHFKSHSTAQIVQMFANFITGLCLMIVHFVLCSIDKTK